jgi:hypothetical protein
MNFLRKIFESATRDPNVMKWCDPLPIMLGVLASLPYQAHLVAVLFFVTNFCTMATQQKKVLCNLCNINIPRNSNALNSSTVVDLSTNMLTKYFLPLEKLY